MAKKFSMLLILVGLIIIGVSGYEIYQNKMLEKESLDKAREKIDQQKAEREAFSPFTGEVVGILKIPRIEAELPIVEGTDEDELAKGVGHYNGTAWPLDKNQIVLSGHRDTVFRRMSEVQIGDELIVEVPYGKFTYKIENFKIVDKDDRTVIRPTAPEEVLTVTTCYPFSYLGSAPDRYIVTAKPVE